MKLSTLLIPAAFIFLFGCASPNMKHSSALDDALYPVADKALVYFIRPRKTAPRASAAVYDGDEFVGIVPYKQKLPYFADPGEHLFMVVSEAADFMSADLMAGKTYYVQVVPRMGSWRARFSLWPVKKEDFEQGDVQNWISNSQLIQNNDNAHQWAENSSKSVAKKKSAYLPKWETKGPERRPHLAAEDGI